MQKGKARKLVTVSMLSTISYLLMMLDFPFPGLPPFLKIDFSEVPALLAAIILGPLAGITVEAIKNLLHYGIQGSLTGVPVGEAANFVAGTLFIVPTSYFFRKYQTFKGLSAGLITGTIVMTALMAVLNYVLFLPAYTWFLGSPALSSSAMLNTIVAAIAPFNLIKGVLVTLLFLVLFVRLRPWVIRQYQQS